MTRIGTASAAAMILSVLALASPAAAATTVFGQGFLTFDGCPVGSDNASIAGVNDGATWTFAVGDVNGDVPSFCAFGDGQTYQGPWTTAGGCIPALLPAGAGTLCIGAVAPGVNSGVPVTACFNVLFFCATGTATLVVA